jgi:hypothetical protein
MNVQDLAINARVFPRDVIDYASTDAPVHDLERVRAKGEEERELELAADQV